MSALLDRPRLDKHHGSGGAARLLAAVARLGLDEAALPAAAALVERLDADAAERAERIVSSA